MDHETAIVALVAAAVTLVAERVIWLVARVANDTEEVVSVADPLRDITCPDCTGEGWLTDGVLQWPCRECNGTGRAMTRLTEDELPE